MQNHRKQFSQARSSIREGSPETPPFPSISSCRQAAVLISPCYTMVCAMCQCGKTVWNQSNLTSCCSTSSLQDDSRAAFHFPTVLSDCFPVRQGKKIQTKQKQLHFGVPLQSLWADNRFLCRQGCPCLCLCQEDATQDALQGCGASLTCCLPTSLSSPVTFPPDLPHCPTIPRVFLQDNSSSTVCFEGQT